MMCSWDTVICLMSWHIYLIFNQVNLLSTFIIFIAHGEKSEVHLVSWSSCISLLPVVIWQYHMFSLSPISLVTLPLAIPTSLCYYPSTTNFYDVWNFKYHTSEIMDLLLFNIISNSSTHIGKNSRISLFCWWTLFYHICVHFLYTFTN